MATLSLVRGQSHLRSPFSSEFPNWSIDEESGLGISKAAKTIRINGAQAFIHYIFPISIQDNSVFRFYPLADTWKYETKLLSSPSAKAMHPAYQKIIGMGKEAVPLIMKELQNNSDYWFWALKAITGVDPVAPDNRGNIQKMRSSWLEWGRANGYA